MLKIKADGKGAGKPVNEYDPYSPKHNPGSDFSQFDDFGRNNPSLPLYLPSGELYLKDDVVEGERKFRFKTPRGKWVYMEGLSSGNKDDYGEWEEYYRVHPVVKEGVEKESYTRAEVLEIIEKVLQFTAEAARLQSDYYRGRTDYYIDKQSILTIDKHQFLKPL